MRLKVDLHIGEDRDLWALAIIAFATVALFLGHTALTARTEENGRSGYAATVKPRTTPGSVQEPT